MEKTQDKQRKQEILKRLSELLEFAICDWDIAPDGITEGISLYLFKSEEKGVSSDWNAMDEFVALMKELDSIRWGKPHGKE